MVAATSFGEWLTLRRQNLHLQRTELATRTGCAVVTLRKIEADERRPSREFAERLASELGIPPPQRGPKQLALSHDHTDRAGGGDCGSPEQLQPP